MIDNKEQYFEILKRDRIASGFPTHPSFGQRLKQLLWPDKIIQFEKALRNLEYSDNQRSRHKNSVYWLTRWIIAKFAFRKLSLKLGFSIPPHVFGPGLSIPHYGNIVVNPNARIGENCRIHVGVNIGASGGANKVPKIGNNVYIGPGAILFGDITVADNVFIGANSTVTKSILKPNVVVAGSPARIIREDVPNWIESLSNENEQ